MKKTLLTFITVLSLIQLTRAQWTASGPNIYNTNTGGVGIGTTPSRILDVAGAPLSGGGAATGLMSTFINNSTAYNSSPTAAIGFSTKYSSLGAMFPMGIIQAGKENTTDGDYAGYLAFLTGPNGGPFAERMRVASTGNVGIGTISPGAKLHIAMDANTSGAPNNAQFFITGSTSADKRLSLAYNTSSNYGEIQAQAFAGSYSPLNLNPNGGNVLIGKTSQANSAYLLDVAGSIRSSQVVVNTTGADFVFAPAYRLNSLSDIKQYIDQYHHLPEIPSAAQMQKEGLNVGDNEVKLLQKIEELTLYMIENDKKDKERQTELDGQKQKLLDQEKHIKLLEAKLDELLKKNL